MAEEVTGKPMRWRYVEENRIGDHICYYSDLRKMRAHYPDWDITKPLRRHLRGDRRQAGRRRLARRKRGLHENSDHRRSADSSAARWPMPCWSGARASSISGMDNLMRPGSEMQPRAAAASWE